MRVVVIGAGIAGLAAAIELRALGLHVELFERHARPSTLGAGVVCWPNACFVLERLGVLDRVANAGHPIVEMRRRSDRGEPLGSLGIERINRALAQRSVAILRVDLHQILLDAAIGAGARVHHGETVVDVVDGGQDRAHAQLGSGARVGADLILGADGRMNSPARRYVAGSCAPRYQGFVNWIGVVQDPRLRLEPGVVLDIWGCGLRFGIVPVASNQAYWAAGMYQSQPTPSAPDRLPEILKEHFGGWPQPVRSIVGGCVPGAAREIHVYDHDPLPRWHRRNVLLLGDAAHAALPTSGQGACQALEDAWHLARVLEREPSVELACTQLFERRASKTSAITQVGRRLARSLFDPAPTACTRRNAQSVTTDFEAMARGVGELWSRGLPMASGDGA